MQLSDVFLGLGEDRFQQLMRSISLGKLKAYQIYDRFKTRLYLNKLNSETLRKSAARTWARIAERDEDFATDVAQAILISHMEMIKAVLDYLGIPHEEGFFAKDANVSSYLKEEWRERVWEKFHEAFPAAPLLFYINHLGWEMAKAEDVYVPAS
ncbi:MAG TPA: hypothetical protein VKV74_07870 [Bryobacteraceae bacterium]|nr:hypothetical protein [Bryobacteraceae bacterium]